MVSGLLRGKGIWIRRIADCEGGDLPAISARALASGYSHVLIKIADGAEAYNLHLEPHFDAAAELTRRLSSVGIAVWGWHSVYGEKPRFKSAPRGDYHLREAACAVERVAQLKRLGLQGYVIDTLGDYEYVPDRASRAARFMDIVRDGLADLPIALSAWRLPNTHRRFPWAEFRRRCDLDMPQVFWTGRQENVTRHLSTSLRQYEALTPQLAYVPAGSMLVEGDRLPSTAGLITFLATALALGLPAANLSAWDLLGLTGDEPTGNPQHLDFRGHWKAAADFVWALTQAGPAEPEVAKAPSWAIPEVQEAFEAADFQFDLEPEDELPEWLQFLNEPAVAPPEPAAAPEPAADLPPSLDVEADVSYETELGLEPEDELPAWLEFSSQPEGLPQPVVASLTPEVELAPSPDVEPELPDEPARVPQEPTPEPDVDETIAPQQHALSPAGMVAHLDDAAPEIEFVTDVEPPFAPADQAPSLPAIEPAATAPLSTAAPDEVLLPHQHALAPARTVARLEAVAPEIEFVTAMEPAFVPADQAPSLSATEPAATSVLATAAPDEALPPQQHFVLDQVAPLAFMPEAAAEPEQVPEAVSIEPPPLSAVPAGAAEVSPGSTVGSFFEALRQQRTDDAVALYGSRFAHVNDDRVTHDREAVREFYAAMLARLKVDELVWLVLHGSRTTTSVHWMAHARDGTPVKCKDVFHFNRDGQIVYHDTSFRIN